MKILVIGDSGFIGSFLVKKLEELGHEVSGLNTGNGDVLDSVCVNSFVEGCDIVFHLAGLSSVWECERKPSRSLELNFDSTKNVVLACRLHESKMVFASSCLVYGSTQFYPTEEDVHLSPGCFYAIHKKLSEDLCDKHQDFIARLGGVYGPSNKCHNILTKFIKNMKEKKKIPMYQNGHVTRDFVYIDDVVEGLVMGLKHEGVYNISTGVETSISSLLNRVSRLTKLPYETEDMGFRMRGETDKVHLDITKLKMLGWHPKISLDEGIKRCADVG